MSDRVGVDPIAPSIMEDNSGAYLDWFRMKPRARVLVHVDSHLDAERVDERMLRRVLGCRNLKAVKALERYPYDNRTAVKILDLKNYVTYAAAAGMLRETWWIAPEKSLARHCDKYRRIIEESALFLKADEAKSFSFKDGMIRMRLYGLRLNVCVLEDLPRFDEPVLLDIDVDYFDPPWQPDFLAPPWKKPAELLDAFAAKGLRADWVGVCYSNRQGYLALWKRDLGHELVERLRAPGVAGSRVPPPLRTGSGLRAPGPPPSNRFSAAARLISRRDFTGALRGLAGLDVPHAHYLRSFCLERLGRPAQARAARDLARRGEPIYAEAGLFEADWHFHKQRYAEAVRLYAKLLRGAASIDKQVRVYIHFNVGWAFLELGENARAREAFEGALRLMPDNVPALSAAARAAERMGDLDGAAAHYEKLLKFLPDHFAARYNYGSLLLRLGRRKQAMGQFLKAIKSEPEHAKSLHNLAGLCAADGLSSEAKALYAEFLRIWPRQDGVADAVRAKVSALNGAPLVTLKAALARLAKHARP